MDFKLKRLAWHVMPSVVALALSGCGGSDSSSSGGSEAASNPVVKLPTITPLDIPDEPYLVSELQGDDLVLSLVDNKSIIGAARQAAASAYSNYNLYLWNNPTCKALADDETSADWDDVSRTPDKVDNYGPVWKLKLASADQQAGDCINFIMRDASKNKVSGDADGRLYTTQQFNAIVRGGSLYTSRADAFANVKEAAFGVADASAHLIDATTLLWDGGKEAKHVNLYFVASGNVEPDAEGHFQFDQRFDLTPTTLSAEQLALLDTKHKTLKGLAAFKLPSNANVKDLLKGELIALSSDSDGVIVNGTQVQTAEALDSLYAAAATQLDYGAIVTGDKISFRVWAPTAKSVKVVLFAADKTQTGSLDMNYDAASGAWSVDSDTSLKGQFYRYELSVYHPKDRTFHQYQVTDPYSLSLSTNSAYSQIVDLNDADLKPEGWDSLAAPHKQASQTDLAKMVILESHMRDLTAFDEGITEAERGKFVALANPESVTAKYLKEQADAGVTHLHLLPVFDIATVNEDETQRVDLTDKFSKLCAINASLTSSNYAAHCDGAETVGEVLASLQVSDSAENPVAQDLYDYIRGYDSFNWGYDPYHFTVPEGSYSTNPDGTARILEMRQMVKAIKETIGMNVVMDVVYNHTNASGPVSDKSVLDKVVPWYYQRLDDSTGSVTNSSCCDNTAPENAMFAKLIDDSLITWSQAYKIDAFRFDLMGHHPLKQMTDSLAKVKAVSPEMYFYGEGWNFGEVADDARFVQARQAHLGGTGIGSFSDRLRDAVRGGSPFDSGENIRQSQGFGNGAFVYPNETDSVDQDSARHLADLTRLGMAGNLADFVLTDKDGIPTAGSDLDYNGQPAGYAQDPIEIQNYVAKHDNQTLFDIIAYKAPQGDMEQRIRMQGISAATVLLGQGMPFDQQGTELLRSKSFERDSYDSGDWYNKVDYSMQTNNYDVGLPRKDKDGDNYVLIEQVKNLAGSPIAQDLSQMRSFYNELVALRKSSPLFMLGTGVEVMARVDFRNVGTEQLDGLIAMTIDNGTQVSDLDSTVDGILVLINASPTVQHIGGFVDGASQPIDLSGFELSTIQTELGTASIANGSSVADGQFTAQPWSASVFVKPRLDTRSVGLPVSEKKDMSIEPAYGETALYLRGFMGDWTATEANQFSFTGANFSYEYAIELTDEQIEAVASATTLKIADAGWTAGTNFGACGSSNTLTAGGSLKLCQGGGDVNLALTKAGTYRFVLNAKKKNEPTLTLIVEEAPAVCQALPVSTETPTLGDTKLALRGSHSNWAWDAQYQLTYKGQGQYEFVTSGAVMDGKEFKIAADTTNWDPQFFATQGGKLVSSMAADTVYEAFARFGSEGTDPGNNKISLDTSANYLFRLKIDTSKEIPAKGAGVFGTMDVCQLPQ